MTAARVFTQVRDAIAHLNPHEVRNTADLPFTIQLFAASPEGYAELEAFFTASNSFSPARQVDTTAVVHRGGDNAAGTLIRIYGEGVPHGASDFAFHKADPQRVVCDILERHPDLNLSLAKRVAPFREPVAQDVIFAVSKENALFSVATAIPSIMPLVSLPWAVGEFASDTAFLTANQIRMAFMLAASSNRVVGYRQQKAEIASLFAGAFGWRALARELSGKIPFGGGIIPKAAIAFAGTYVVGASLERYYRVGYGYTPQERRDMYAQMLERGKEVATSLVRTHGPGREVR
jgi:hypothetical protein